MVERADAVIIGAGLGGLPAGVTLAGQGRAEAIYRVLGIADRLRLHLLHPLCVLGREGPRLALAKSQNATG